MPIFRYRDKLILFSHINNLFRYLIILKKYWIEYSDIRIGIIFSIYGILVVEPIFSEKEIRNIDITDFGQKGDFNRLKNKLKRINNI